MGRIIAKLVSMLCLVLLVFTDLDVAQRLLLIGAAVPAAVLLLWDQLTDRA